LLHEGFDELSGRRTARSDNGPQFVAREFKEFIRLWQTSHVSTSPHYPQSNGKLEHWNAGIAP
jgi:hypothetical protein